jgi:hypothetical protein
VNDDIMQRLRTLAPELPEPGDRFDQVRARVQRRRRRLAMTASVAAAVVAAAGVPAGLALTGGGPGRTHGPANPGSLSCPDAYEGAPPWVPDKPTGVDGASRLVPLQPPLRALVCAYDGSNMAATTSGWTLSGSRTLTRDLDRLAEDLAWLPRQLAGQQIACTAVGGPQTNFAVGLIYPGATLWVSTADEPNDCVGTSNGEFTSTVSIGRQVAAAYAAGRWVPAPPPRVSPTDDNPCWVVRSGRLGQETAMVPADPVSVQVCKATVGSRDVGYETRTATAGYRDLVERLNALPTQVSRSGCQGHGTQTVFYQLLFRYAVGPPVRLRVDADCDPSIDNQSLQARDATNVLPLIESLLRGGS